MSRLICLVLSVVVVGLSSIYACMTPCFTKKQREVILDGVSCIMKSCSEEHGVPYNQLKLSQACDHNEEINPCFLGCVFRKCGLIDDKCHYKSDNALDILSPYLPHDVFLIYQEKAKECAYVNDNRVPCNCDDPDCCYIGPPLASCYRDKGIEMVFTILEPCPCWYNKPPNPTPLNCTPPCTKKNKDKPKPVKVKVNAVASG